MTDLGLILTYIMIVVAMLACIISPILKMQKNPAKMQKMIIPMIGLLLIIIFSIVISSNEVLPNYTDSNGVLISSTLSKVIGGSLITFYVLSLITVGAVIYSEFLYNFFKNGKK